MIEILNMCLHQNSIVIKFFKILKIREIFCENPRIIFFLFYDVHKENMFTNNLEDGREAPSKASYIINIYSHTNIYNTILNGVVWNCLDILSVKFLKRINMQKNAKKCMHSLYNVSRKSAPSVNWTYMKH